MYNNTYTYRIKKYTVGLSLGSRGQWAGQELLVEGRKAAWWVRLGRSTGPRRLKGSGGGEGCPKATGGGLYSWV
jgi:hypothetical protein